MTDSSDFEDERGRSKRKHFFHNVKESLKDEMLTRTYEKAPYLGEGLRAGSEYGHTRRRRFYSSSPHPMAPMSMGPQRGMPGGYSPYSPYYYESWTDWIMSWLDCIFSRPPPPPMDPYGYNRSYENHHYLRPRSHSHLGAHLRPEAEYYGMYARSPSRRRPLL